MANKKKSKKDNLSPKLKKLQGILPASKDFDYKKVLEEEINKKYNE